MSLIDLKADIKTRQLGFFYEARDIAGPDPMHLPKRIMFYSGMLIALVR
jgi:hypothetical protein